MAGPPDYRSAKDHRDHLIDVDSGKLTEFHSKAIEWLQAKIGELLGYELTGHRLEQCGRLKSRESDFHSSALNGSSRAASGRLTSTLPEVMA
ncbi:MAG: transcriptional repressor [Proteobacteria bacterium]|nr:transcriptional repressor [Pseudomonadota bacterium]